MCHEAISHKLALPIPLPSCRNDVLRDPLQHTPRLQDKSWQHNPTQIRTRSQLRDDMRQYYSFPISACLFLSYPHSANVEGSSPLPWSGSTTVVSSSGPSDLDSSTEDLLPVTVEPISPVLLNHILCDFAVVSLLAEDKKVQIAYLTTRRELEAISWRVRTCGGLPTM